MTTLKIQPINVQEYTVKQSKYEVCGKLPIRSVILGQSGSWKTVLLQNMILDIYRDCFSRIYILAVDRGRSDMATSEELHHQAHEREAHKGGTDLL